MKHLIPALLFGTFLFAQEKNQLSVYFDSGSSVISDSGKNELSTFFSNEEIQVLSVSVLGYCDDVGSSESNVILSEKRAENVSLFLKSNFELDEIATAGKGEIAINGEVSEGLRSENRRATVSISYQINPKEIAEAKNPDNGYKTFNDTLSVGDKVIINQLLFDGSRTSFLNPEDAELELSKIIDYFKKNPTVNFQINGHVCCISSTFKDARNLETGLNNLSKARAQKIFDYFVSKGISKERMSHEGYGRQFPREGVIESLNKRVEIVITKI